VTLPAIFAFCGALCALAAGLIHRGAMTGMGDAFIWLVAGLVFASLAHLVYGKVGR
jgi:hypothetical protein